MVEYKEFEKEEELDESLQEKPITKPFDTRNIKISNVVITLDNIVKRLIHDEIDLNPDFQRNGNLWNNTKMSRLIESMILKLPLPVFYFDVSDNNKWIVIDGLQRLSTIKSFIVDKKLKLKNLEFLNELEGKKFDELGRNFQRIIEETQLITYQMEPQTPKEVRYSIFSRINTGGLILNPQEIRQALNQKHRGVKLLQEITEDKIFIDIVKIESKRMLDRELVLRFIAFKKCNYNKFSEKGITLPKFLDETMEEIDSIEFEQEEFSNLKTSLLETLIFLNKIFDEKTLFNKKLVDESKTRTLNRSLFEVWTVLVSELSDKEKEVLFSRKDTLKSRYCELLRTNEFNDAISKGTNDRKTVIARFSLLQKLIEEIIL